MAASFIIAQTPQSNIVPGKPSDPEHQRFGRGFRAFTINRLGVAVTVAATAAAGTRDCRRIWRSSSATGSHPANLIGRLCPVRKLRLEALSPREGWNYQGGCDHLFPFFKLHFIPAHYVLIEDSGARTSRFL